MKSLVGWTAFVWAIVSTASAQEMDRTLAYLPSSINSVAVVRVQDLLASPRGKKEQWGRLQGAVFLAGALEAGADVNLIVRGFEFHPEDSHLSHSVGVVSFAKPVSLTQLAKREAGHLDKIVDKTVVHSAQRGFFVGLEPRVLGTMEPSYRQNVARWLRTVSGQQEPAISPYLKEAAQASRGHVVLALDLADMVDPHILRERLAGFSLLVNDAKQQEAVAKLLEQLRGLRATVTVTDRIEAEVAVDFAITPGAKLSEMVRPLLQEVLSRGGAMIDELDQAKSRVEDKSVILSMPLSDASARQVLSLAFASTSGADLPVEGSAESAELASEAKTLATTKNYLTSVNRLVDDLQAKAQKSKDYQKTAVWHETYSKRIDQLSVKDVDADALTYASGVSSKLRALAVSLRGVPLEVNRLANSVTYDVQYTPWAAGVNVWGGVGYRPPNYQVNTNQGAIQAQQAAAIAAGEKARYEVWKMLADDRQAVRLKMREKYNVDVE